MKQPNPSTLSESKFRMPTDVNNKAVGINAYDIVKGLEVFIIGIICAYLLIRCIKSQKDAKIQII